MLLYTKKDITTVESGIIIHGCNAQGKMASGVAKVLRDKYPQIYEPYKHHCDMHSSDRQSLLGDISLVRIDPTLYIANAITQLYYGKDGKKYASAQAIYDALSLTADFASIQGLFVYLPRIGAGLGGLDWDDEVVPIIMKVAKDHTQIDIIVCDI